MAGQLLDDHHHTLTASKETSALETAQRHSRSVPCSELWIVDASFWLTVACLMYSKLKSCYSAIFFHPFLQTGLRMSKFNHLLEGIS